MKKLSLCLYVAVSISTVFLSACITGGGTFEDNQYYTVTRGDTLSKVAATYNINYLKLARQNNLQYPYILQVGQRLYVGTPPATSAIDNTSDLPKRTTITMSTQSTVHPIAQSSALSAQSLDLSQYAGPTPKAKAATATPSAAPTSSKSLVDGLQVSTAPTQTNDLVTWAWPVNGTIMEAFGEGKNLLARGVQISVAPKSKVLAAAQGQVLFSGTGTQDYGKMVIIKHGNNLLTAYTDLSKILVSQGQKVKLGQVIALSGTINGQSWLHFEVRKFGNPVNPLIYLPVPDDVKPAKALKPITKPKIDAAT